MRSPSVIAPPFLAQTKPREGAYLSLVLVKDQWMLSMKLCSVLRSNCRKEAAAYT